MAELLSYSQTSNPDTGPMKRLFPLLMEAAVTHFELQEYSSAKKSPCRRPYSSWPDCNNQEEKGRRDASIVVDLYQRLLRHDTQKATALLGRISNQIFSISQKELDRFVFPLLEQMLSVVDLCSLDVRKFYQTAMFWYVIRVVRTEPEKPTDWAKPFESLCYIRDCVDCQSLQKFMLDPDKQTESFAAQQPSHLFGRVPGECKKKYQPGEMVAVTKTHKIWEKEYDRWQERASATSQKFRRLPEEQLRTCLEGQYEPTMNLRMVKIRGWESDPPVDKKRARDQSCHHRHCRRKDL